MAAAAVLVPPEQDELLTLDGTAAVIGRSRQELQYLLALPDVPLYRETIPEPVHGEGRTERRQRNQVVTWAVEVGLITPDGQVLVGYPEIAAMLDREEQTIRKYLSARNTSGAQTWPIPAPYGRYPGLRGDSANKRPVWLRDLIMEWAHQTEKLSVDGTPLRRRKGGWAPSPDAVPGPPGRPGQRRRGR